MINLFKAFLTTLAFTLNLVGIYQNKVNNTNFFLVEIYTVFIFLFFFYQFYANKEPKKKKGLSILALIFSFFMLFGYSYLKIDSWNLVLGNFKMIILSIFLYFGYYFFFFHCLSYLEIILERKKEKEIDVKKNKILQKFINQLEEHPIRTSFLVLIIFWFIYIIAFYPIILSPDPSFQIKMFFNEHTKYIDWVIPINNTVYMTTHHPVVHTFLLGGCIQLGRIMGSDNLGLFIYSIIQTITLAFTLSYTIYYTKKLKMKNSIRILLLFIYALVPMFPFYAMSGVKDTYYTCFMILYTLFLFDLFFFYREKKLPWKFVILHTIIILLVMLFRNNGIYVILLSFPFLFFIKRLDHKKLFVIFTISLGCYFTFTKVITPMLGISEGSIREVLSLPFQQTARYVKYHEKDLTEEDKEILDKVLGYDNLKENYQPTIADPIKNNYNKYTTNDDLKDYFKVWWKGFLKHPDTYIEATMNNVYGYFYPNSTRWYIYYKYDTRITQNNLVDYHYNSLSGLRNVLSGYGVSFPYIPGIGMISNIGFCSWILFFLVYLVIDRKKKELLIILLPSLVSLLICVASPVNCYFRYAMPYLFMIPFLIFTFIHVVVKKEGSYEKR